MEAARQCARHGRTGALVHKLIIELLMRPFLLGLPSVGPLSRARVDYQLKRGGMPLQTLKRAQLLKSVNYEKSTTIENCKL